MASKKTYFDNFFWVVKKFDDIEKTLKDWKQTVIKLEEGRKFVPVAYKAKGRFVKSTREDHIEMYKQWIDEFEKRLD